MSGSKVARRYAEGLFLIAGERDSLNEMEDGLSTAAEIFKKEPDLWRIYRHPRVEKSSKHSLIDEVFRSFDTAVVALLKLLVDKKRTYLFLEIARQFTELADKHRGVETAVVTSAVELDDKTAKLLAKKLEKLTNKKIRLKKRLDPGLLGGLIVQVKGKVIDGSVRYRLSSLAERLHNTSLGQTEVNESGSTS